MRKTIVVCFNGEPRYMTDNMPYVHGWTIYGPFEGIEHAKLWMQAVHVKEPCTYTSHAGSKHKVCAKGECETFHTIMYLNRG